MILYFTFNQKNNNSSDALMKELVVKSMCFV